MDLSCTNCGIGCVVRVCSTTSTVLMSFCGFSLQCLMMADTLALSISRLHLPLEHDTETHQNLIAKSMHKQPVGLYVLIHAKVSEYFQSFSIVCLLANSPSTTTSCSVSSCRKISHSCWKTSWVGIACRSQHQKGMLCIFLHTCKSF